MSWRFSASAWRAASTDDTQSTWKRSSSDCCSSSLVSRKSSSSSSTNNRRMSEAAPPACLPPMLLLAVMRSVSIQGEYHVAQRQADDEGAAHAGLTACADVAAMAFHDTSADGKTDAGAAVFRSAVQALEGREDACQEFFVETDAIVRDLDLHPAALAAGRAL